MAQQQQQQTQGYHPWGHSSAQGSARPRPGKLLLGDIQSLQRQQAAAGSSTPLGCWQHGQLLSQQQQRAPNVLATLASSADSSTSTDNESVQCSLLQQFGEPVSPSSAAQHKQQQHQQALPFWKGPPHLQQQQACHSRVHEQHQHDQHEHLRQPLDPTNQQQQQQQPSGKLVAFRQPGSIGPQFASATLSGSSGSGSDSPTALKAVGRVFGNGEICKLLGLIGAQLLMHLAHLQHGMHQLHLRQQQQQGLGSGSGHYPDQQQQGGFGSWRLRMPWQRQEGQAGNGDSGLSQGASSRSNAAWQAGEAAKQWITRGVVAERNIELREALACYTNAVTLEPGNREYLCRLAKQWSDLTYEEGATVEQIQEVNTKAMEYAERVIAMSPRSADGYLASCVSKGRLALFSENKTKLKLAKEAQEAARTAVEMDAHNDLAHHLMGRWHFEMAQINFVLRQLIRIVYGASLNPGTFEEALTEFQTAVALNPNKLIHRVELGRTHLRLGHKRDAYQHLLASMDCEVEDINAKLQKEDAELLLAKLQAELKGRTELPASWGGFTAPGIAAVEDSSSSSSVSSCKVEEVGADDGSSGGAAGGDAAA